MSENHTVDQLNINIDRPIEKREDSNKLLEEAILELPLIRSVACFFSDGPVAQGHSANILQTACIFAFIPATHSH